METHQALEFLDHIQNMLPVQYLGLSTQFQDVKQHMVAMANGRREALQFSTNEELYDELAKRHNASMFIGSMNPLKDNTDLENYTMFLKGGATACIGLSDVLGMILRQRLFNKP